MDKRFFLALFLSLIVIALSQLLFPPVKPATVPLTGTAKDTSSTSQAASSTQPSVAPAPIAAASQTRITAAVPGATTTVAAETTEITTAKAIYRFSNIGAAPVSIVMRDYQRQASSGGHVDLGIPGASLLAYRLVTPTDTADLSQVPFSLSQAKNEKGDELLTYRASVKGLPVSITYSIPQDTAASYTMHAEGRVEGLQGQAYLLTELPRTLLPTEVDTVGDHQSLAYSVKPQRDHARSVLFGGLDPGEKTLEAGPLNWAAVKNKYFVFGILAPANGTPFSEVTLTGGPRTSKVATNASASVVQAIR
ncbi:MAG TPA: hypothetical protein VK575_04150, partial [Gemmatimonadaceae bacterium]|nr:hypothetical protein [Gemmatimonadaceae bacterium]